MNTWNERLKHARTLRGLKKNAFAERIKVSTATTSDWESGVIRTMEASNLLKICSVLKIRPEWLLHGTGEIEASANTEPAPDIKQCVPLLSWVQAGNWKESVATQHPSESESIETTYKAKAHTYALRVRGDSMEPKFPDGAILIVEPDEEPLPGKFVIVRQNGDTETTFKQLIRDGGTLYLKPLNDRYPIMLLKPDAVFCGVVKRVEMDV